MIALFNLKIDQLLPNVVLTLFACLEENGIPHMCNNKLLIYTDDNQRQFTQLGGFQLLFSKLDYVNIIQFLTQLMIITDCT